MLMQNTCYEYDYGFTLTGILYFCSNSENSALVKFRCLDRYLVCVYRLLIPPARKFYLPAMGRWASLSVNS